MPETPITMRQLLAVIFAALLSPAIRVLPGGVAQAAGEAGWLALLLALPIALALCWVLFQLLLPLPPGTGLAEACPLVLGKIGGKLALALCLLWGLLQLSVTVRMCGQRFLITGYRNRPVIFYMIVLLAVALWMARGKLAAFGRAGEVFHAILAVTLGIVLLLAAFQMEPENLLPIWIEDLPAAGAAVVPVLSLLGYAVPGAFLAGRLKRQDKDRSRAFRWTVWLCLLLSVLLLVALGCLGPDLISRVEQPFFVMVKGIGVQGAFQRVESVVMALWVLSDLMLIGMLVLSACAVSKVLFGLKRAQSAAVPVAAVTLAGSIFLFQDAFAVERFADGILTAGNLAFGFGFPLVLLVVGKIRGKRV